MIDTYSFLRPYPAELWAHPQNSRTWRVQRLLDTCTFLNWAPRDYMPANARRVRADAPRHIWFDADD